MNFQTDPLPSHPLIRRRLVLSPGLGKGVKTMPLETDAQFLERMKNSFGIPTGEEVKRIRKIELRKALDRKK
jgi:hypothetical protein